MREGIGEEVVAPLEARKKQVAKTLYKHSMGRCQCSKVRNWECRNTQKRLRRIERAYREVIRDLNQ